MQLRDSTDRYGIISIALHWLVAAAAFGLFGLGLWMVDLGYYEAWYHRAPHIHKSAGVLLFGAMLARMAWRYANPRPRLMGSSRENRLALAVHSLLYLLLFALTLSGYLISTADGRAIQVFDLFSVPASLSGLKNQADIAGQVHKLLGYALMSVAALHAGAALKHHFIDRDGTLKRMLGGKP